jgi:hypothetical protein
VPSVDKKEPLENDTRVLGRLQKMNLISRIATKEFINEKFSEKIKKK